MVEVGVVEERFRGNAADVQTCATQFPTLLNTGSLIEIDQLNRSV